MTASRMRTIPAGRALACALVAAALLMGGCIALGYFIAAGGAGPSTSATSALRGGALDARRPEGRVVVDRIGDLSGRLTRLEAQARAMAQRLGIVEAPDDGATVDIQQDGDARPRGGPLLPYGDDAPMSRASLQASPGDYGAGLSHLETELELLQDSLDRIEGVLADRDLASMAYPNRLPVQGHLPRISSGFGVRHDPFTGRLARHMGLDIPAAHGTAILASGGGRVLWAGFRGPYGNAVIIDHGHGLQTLYGHCSKLYVRVGELVMPQQKIAAVGSTGRSTGPHLHFEVIRNGKRVAPGQVLDAVLARNTP